MDEHITVPNPLPAGPNGQPEPLQEMQLVPAQPTGGNDGIAGMSVLRGLLLYAAVLVFIGLYVDFMVVIATAKSGTKPAISAALISAAAALSGVLGSAFALKIGVTPNASTVNSELADSTNGVRGKVRAALSLEPGGTASKSWPLTLGIWAYACVASAVVVVYILDENQTPGSVKALAVTFGGYVIALINNAYSMGKEKVG